MKPTGTPVYRPTADCIWSSFHSSGKRHLILTGDRGSGKTTLLKALFPSPTSGITTWAQPGKAVWLEENSTCRRAQIGVFQPDLPGRENQMMPLLRGFLSLGIPALTRCLETEGPWITIDEIGYLECGNEAYCDAVRRVMEQKQLAAVVRKQDLPFLQELPARDDTFTVDLDRPYGTTGCVIMASGLGVRFGGNKLMADFRGEPLIVRILAATEGIFARRVVITRHQEVAALCRERGVEVLLHNLSRRSDTIRLGLEAVGQVDGCMFCPGDQPLLRWETVAALALAWVNDRACIWRTGFETQPGAPVLFPRWAFPELLTLPAGMGGGYVAKKRPERVRTLPIRDKYELIDVDIPETLQLLERNASPD